MIKLLAHKHMYLFIAVMLFIQIGILALVGSPLTPMLIAMSIVNILMYLVLWIMVLKYNKKAVKTDEKI